MEYNKELKLFERYLTSLLETSQAKFLITESQGLIDPLIPIAEEVIKQILTTIQPDVEKKHFYFGVINVDTTNMENAFFKSLSIQFKYIEERVPIATILGVYNQIDSVISEDGIDVVISITSHAQDNRFIEKLRSCIIHELAHAYDDYMETINSKYGKSYARIESNQIVNRIALSYYFLQKDTLEGKLSEIISFILKSEKESEQNEFLAEVMRLSKMKVFTDPRNLTAYVSNTEFYKNMMRIKSYLDEILNLSKENEKKQVTDAFNEIYREKNFSFDQICNFLLRQWNYRKNNLFKHVAKHIFEQVEIYVENPSALSRFLADF